MDKSLATDEEYEEEESPWDEYDYYDFPEDNEDGLFDPMEKEDIP